MNGLHKAWHTWKRVRCLIADFFHSLREAKRLTKSRPAFSILNIDQK